MSSPVVSVHVTGNKYKWLEHFICFCFCFCFIFIFYHSPRTPSPSVELHVNIVSLLIRCLPSLNACHSQWHIHLLRINRRVLGLLASNTRFGTLITKREQCVCEREREANTKKNDKISYSVRLKNAFHKVVPLINEIK